MVGYDYDEYDDVEHVFSLEERDHNLNTNIWRQISQNNSNIAHLTYNNSRLFGSLVPEWYYSRVFSTLKILHRAMLESTLEQPIDVLLRQTLSDEDLSFFLKIKNKTFRKMGANVSDLEEHKEHPVQKRLVREGYLSKNEIKRRKTPNQHITYVKGQRDLRDMNKLMDARIKELEQTVFGLQTTMSAVVVQQTLMANVVSDIQSIVLATQEELKDKVKDIRKISLYTMKNSDEKMSYSKVAKCFNITKATAIKWYKEVDNALNGA